MRAVSAEARNVRHDVESGQKLARMMRKLTDYKVERRFVEIRKTVSNGFNGNSRFLY